MYGVSSTTFLPPLLCSLRPIENLNPEQGNVPPMPVGSAGSAIWSLLFRLVTLLISKFEWRSRALEYICQIHSNQQLGGQYNPWENVYEMCVSMGLFLY